MQRMIEALEPDIACVAALRPTEARWRGRIPAVALEDSRPALWRKLVRRAGLNLAVKPRRSGVSVLKRAVDAPEVTRILVQYLNFAVDLESAWAGTPKPLFVHCHGYDCTWDLREHSPVGQRRFDLSYPRAVQRLARRATIIANSNTTAQRLLESDIPAERIVVKYLGVPIPVEPPKREARRKSSTILYLGRLIDFKGPDLVIRAFEIACSRGMDGQLVVAGDGPLRTMCELLRARSAFRERITLLGAVDARTGGRLRTEADIFTAHNCRGPLSHQEEAFGVSVVEAMAAGLPVVSGRSGSLPEIIEHGEHGILVEPGDVEAHAEAFIRLASDPGLRKRMGEAGWLRAKERFSCERERDQLRAILGLDGAGSDSGVGTTRGEQ